MTKVIEFKSFGLQELTKEETKNANGGLIFLFSALLSNALVLGTIAAAGAYVVSQAEAGYNQACGCN